MNHNTSKKEPSLPGENPTQDIDSHNISYMGIAYVVDRHTPPYMPDREHELRHWINQYMATATAYEEKFTTVFTADGMSLAVLRTMLERIGDAWTSLTELPGYQRSITAYKNIMLYNRKCNAAGSQGAGYGARLPIPEMEAGIELPTASSSGGSGIVALIARQVDALRVHPIWNEFFARQFGVLPTPSSSEDLTSLDPQASATVTGLGGAVEIVARSPLGIRGVDMLQISVDRHDGAGVVLVGTSTHARFTDHHALPVARTNWTYYVQFIDREGIPHGAVSVADVVVQANPLGTPPPQG